MRKGAKVAGGAAVSAVLLVLALPPANVGILGWVCLVPVIWACVGEGLLAGFLGGLVTAMGAACLAGSGLLYTEKWPNGSPNWIYLGFALYAVAIAAATCLVALGRADEPALAVAGRILLVEWALTVVLPAHLALTQWQMSGAMSLTAWTGIWGVDLLVWWVNIAVALGLARRRWPLEAAIPGFVFLVAWLARPSPQLVDHVVSVGLLQDDASDEDRLEARNQDLAPHSEVVVWPELAGTSFAPGGVTTRLEEIAARSRTALITSYEEPGEPLAANVARLFSPGNRSQGYVKRKPFAGERAVHRAGSRPFAAVLTTRSGTVIPVGINICFDTCYPQIMGETRDAMSGPGMILVPTQDPETPHGVIQSLHAAFTTFRAAELATPIVRTDDTAASMAVDDLGAVLVSLPPGEHSTIAHVPIRPARTTLYHRVGDWVLWLDAVAVALWTFARKKRPAPATASPEEPMTGTLF